MLKLRTITIVILGFFLALMGVRHFTFSLATQPDAADEDSLGYMERRFPLLPWLERTDYDLHLRAHIPGPIHPGIVIIDVNERSLRELGQFPFGRQIYAKLLQRLENYGAKVAAFDITFPERERNDSLAALISANEEIQKTEGASSRAAKIVAEKVRGQNGDEEFARALREGKMPVVLGFAFSDQGKSGAPVDRKAMEFLKQNSLFRSQVSDNSAVHQMGAKTPVLPHLALLEAMPANARLGAFDAEPDEDSVIRYAVGAMNFQGMAVTSLAVRAVFAYLGLEPMLSGSDGLEIEDREGTGKVKVPLSPKGSYLLRFYGREHLFPYVEFSDLVSDDAATIARVAEQVRGKIAFVGVSAVGLKDIRANPFSRDYPGVEVHATFASNMLNGSFMEKDQRYFFLGYVFILVLGLLAGVLVHRLHPILSLALSAVLVLGFQYGCQVLFFDRGLVVPTFLPSLAIMAVIFGGVIHRYLTEEKEKRRVRGAFSRYVSGAVVEEILRDQSKLKLGGQKKMLTVMFCDLVGFTKMSEHMDAEKLTLLLNEYFTRMTRLILKNHGTLDKYMGDAVMCFWGAPLDVPDHAILAGQTALEMKEELGKINEEWHAKYGVQIGLRIGIHTGEMNVGNMGSEQVFSYTVMGDNVNLGSRLEGVNNFYGTTIMASAVTAAAAGEKLEFRAVDRVRVKGKADAVELCELMGPKATPAEKAEWLAAWNAALAAYREGNWAAAEINLKRCLELKSGDGPSQTLLSRLPELRAHPPADWDGTWTLREK